MYEQQYGLNRRPFRATATGTDVFVGPQTARLMQAFKKALVSNDAAVAIMGPTGVGKTTLVNRAIDAIDGNKKVIRIGRMQLGHDEVLEFLLDEFQAQNVPASTIRKISLFKKLLADHTAAGTRVFVVVEDAVRIGEDALAEFEALTAADGGDCEGANLVLMGGRTLKPLLEKEPLARLLQRVRVYHTLNPLIAAELLGYFKHCFRLAGGEFDLVFPDGSAQFIYALTGGVPRIANNLVDSVMNAGNDLQLARIDLDLIARVADEEYGLTADMPATAHASPVITAEPEPEPIAEAPEPEPIVAAEPEPAPVIEAPAPEPVAESAPEPESVVAAEPETAPVIKAPAPEPVAESAPEPEPVVAPEPEPAAAIEVPAPEPVAEIAPEPEPVVAPEPEFVPAAAAKAEISAPDAEQKQNAPELIQDTLPNLEVLSPQLAGDTGVEPVEDETPPADGVEDDDEDIPTLFNSGSMVTPVAEDIPDFDKDPTLAQLRPDVEALEEAMASLAEPEEPGAPPAESTAIENVQEATAVASESDTEANPEVKEPTMPALPKITLDDKIEEKIKEATASLEMEDEATAEDAESNEAPVVVAANPEQEDDPRFLKSTTELRNIASGLSKAKTLEDVDDELAETLFGSGINEIAAQVLAKGANQEWLNEDPEPEPETITELELEPTMNSPAQASAAPEVAPQTPESQKSELEKEFMDVYGEDALEVSLETDTPKAGLDLSASQRLATVRALNAEKQPGAANPQAAVPANGAGNGAAAASTPASIEDQIKTSMTQTFAALNVRPTAVNDDDDDDDDEEEKRKGGFFSRFRRS